MKLLNATTASEQKHTVCVCLLESLSLNAEPLVKTSLKICIQDRRDQQWEDEVDSEG